MTTIKSIELRENKIIVDIQDYNKLVFDRTEINSEEDLKAKIDYAIMCENKNRTLKSIKEKAIALWASEIMRKQDAGH